MENQYQQNCCYRYCYEYCFSCFLKDKSYDPSIFEENHKRYRACFGIIHVKDVAVILAFLKSFVLLAILIYRWVTNEDELGRLFGIFAFIAAAISNILLITGICLKRYTFLIPYFTVCVPFIFLLVLGLFVNVMQKVNSKEATKRHSLLSNGGLLLCIVFEVYTMMIVWRAFVYICDYNMEYNLRKSERVRTRAHLTFEAGKDQRIDESQRIVIGDKSDESSDEEEEEEELEEHPELHKKYSIVTAM